MKIQEKNNKNWMDLLRLGFRYNPKESKKILKEIFKEDKKVNSLVKKNFKIKLFFIDKNKPISWQETE